MINMRQKKKEHIVTTNGTLNQNNKITPADYRARLNDYRQGLWDLEQPFVADGTEEGVPPYYTCDNYEMTREIDMRPQHQNNDRIRRLKDGHDQQLHLRNSMHWEEFFGSSLELAPSLMSIYDRIASGSIHQDQNEKKDQSDHHAISSDDSPSSQESSHPQSTPVIKIDSENCSHSSSNYSMESGGPDSDQSYDSKKRPLSVSSMSSSSTSSLPRHISKRPNLSEYEPRNKGHTNIERNLDKILFIDDDTPEDGSGDAVTSMDTDKENKDNCETDSLDQNSNRKQFLKNLSSSDDNVSKSNNNLSGISVSDNNQNEVSSRNASFVSNTDVSQCSESSVSSTPDSSFCHTPSSSSVSSSSLVQSQGRSSISGTPSRHSASLRDSTSPQKYVTRVQRVIGEIVETEKTYVRSLQEIIEGYMWYLKRSPDHYLSQKERECLFGNILQIYEFSRGFSEELNSCEDDAAKVAECFVRHDEGFAIYAQYCTHYPSAVEILTKVMKDPKLCEVFKQQQLALGHSLPLGAYLLKPVQRILKYHLLLHNILKNYDKKEAGYSIISKALDQMTGRAHHINEMKRIHEHAVRVQEIQSQLEEYDGEDLTRLGELVLEGSFRIYGAKTSRHVFLFEKGVLITKRKEDHMLSCKIFIECSNLMLVESVPKEPLSFQVIPFHNPRGQHTLQARNLDQKRKWCQEIKRLILESYKEKIPEKVKGLVMQLGKSKEEENASPELKKFHHHNAPGYLEKRQRMRRKSGGTILTDILKSQKMRRAQKRGESVSPRTSPKMNRKFMSPLAMERPRSLEPQDNDEEDNDNIVCGSRDNSISRETTESDIASLASVNSEAEYLSGPNSSNVNVGRTTSFRSAIKLRPLGSADYDEETASKDANFPTKETLQSRRSRSFRLATRLGQLSSIDSTNSTSSLPNSPVVSSKMDFNGTAIPSPGISDQFQDHVFSPGPDSKSQVPAPTDLSHSHLSHSGKFSSMPVLNNTEVDTNTPANRRPSDCVTSGRKLSGTSFNLGNVRQSPKRVIELNKYFGRNKENFSSSSSSSPFSEEQNSNNLRTDGKTVSALHDCFSRQSKENIQTNSPKLRTKSITLSKPLPLTNVLNKTLHRRSGSAYDGSSASYKERCDHDNPWIYNPSASKENLLEVDHQRQIHQRPHQRTRSMGSELDDYTADSWDWIVYANRNSLPISGYSLEDLPKLYKYCTPPREAVEPQSSIPNTNYSQSKPYHHHHHHHQRVSTAIDAYATPPREVMKPAEMNKYNDENTSSKVSTLSDEELSTISSLPMVSKPLDSRIVHERRQVTLMRSNSTPCSRPYKFSVEGRQTRTHSFDIESLNDHEKIVAEMEDYMKKSDSSATLNSQKFPTSIPVTQEETKSSYNTNRDSYVSTISSSSYESHDSSSENQSSDGIVDTLKHKIHDFTQKFYRRSGSYDNRLGSNSDHELDSDSEKSKRNSDSKWSVNAWFSSPKKEQSPQSLDLQSVLLSRELGSEAIGSRMADPEPIYTEIGFKKQNDVGTKLPPLPPKKDHRLDNVLVSVKAETISKSCDDSQSSSVQKSKIPQFDSAFSIQSDLGDSNSSVADDSPRVLNDLVQDTDVQGTNVKPISRMDSFYEKRLSLAFNDNDVFRDSAVYCDVDIDQHPVSPVTTKPQDLKLIRVPIKQYIQKIEENVQSRPCHVTKVRQREPGQIIKKRMESLQSYTSLRSASCSRTCSEDRELRSCSRSRTVSEDRELSPFSTANVRSAEKTKTADQFFKTFVTEGKLSVKDDNKRAFGKENDVSGYRSRSRSRSKSPGTTLKPALSMGRLDQLSTDVENLVIMKGWVRQLIDKFQPV